MVSRGPSTWALLLAVGSALPGCATQRDTAQALTIAGAAAVLVGASMAADEQCYSAGPGESGVQPDCVPGLSKGARTAGKGLAVAGVGLAAAGYALKPKGPDRMQRPPADPDAVPSSPYRLIRRDPAPEPSAAAPAAATAAPDEAAPAPPSPAPEPSETSPGRTPLAPPAGARPH